MAIIVEDITGPTTLVCENRRINYLHVTCADTGCSNSRTCTDARTQSQCSARTCLSKGRTQADVCLHRHVFPQIASNKSGSLAKRQNCKQHRTIAPLSSQMGWPLTILQIAPHFSCPIFRLSITLCNYSESRVLKQCFNNSNSRS